MGEQGRISKNVSLYENEYKVIDALANSRGLDFSSAVRMIVNEWHDRMIGKTDKTAPEQTTQQEAPHAKNV